MKLKLANNSKYWRIAKEWGDQQDSAYYRRDKFLAVKGVAEYLANEDGLTLFESYVGREYET